MNLDLDLTSFNGGGGMPMECNMRSMAEKRSKTYEDPAIMVSSFFWYKLLSPTFNLNVTASITLNRHRYHVIKIVSIPFSVQFQAPEKRAKFERTADMLAKSGLLDITMKTAELLRSNQQARQELVQLKLEIDEFTRWAAEGVNNDTNDMNRSVLANPENQSGSLRPAARNVFTSNPLSGDLEIPASPKVSVIKSRSTVGGQM